MKMRHGEVDRGLPAAVDKLLRISGALAQRLNQRLQDDGGLSLAQYQFLSVVTSVGQLTLGELAAGLGCTRGNVTGLADRLIEQGLIERVQDPDDRRVVYVRLTEAGHQRLQLCRRLVSEALRSALARSEVAALAGELAALARGDAEAAAAHGDVQPAAEPGSYAEAERQAQRGGEPGRLAEVPEDGVPPAQAGGVRLPAARGAVVIVRDDRVVRLDAAWQPAARNPLAPDHGRSLR